MKNEIKIFNDKQVRTVWDDEKDEWFFSVVDVCNILSESSSKDSGAYWRKLKQRLKKEGSEVVTKCHGLKLPAADGKSVVSPLNANEKPALEVKDEFKKK